MSCARTMSSNFELDVVGGILSELLTFVSENATQNLKISDTGRVLAVVLTGRASSGMTLVFKFHV